MAMTNAPTPHQNPGRKLRMFARLLIAGWYLHASNRAQGSFRTLTSFLWESISPEIVVKRKVSTTTGLNTNPSYLLCPLSLKWHGFSHITRDTTPSVLFTALTGCFLMMFMEKKKLPSAQHAQHLYSLACGAWVRTFERHELK